MSETELDISPAAPVLPTPEAAPIAVGSDSDRASQAATNPRANFSFGMLLADRPLWQIVIGLGVSAIGLTLAAIGLFLLFGLALQGVGRMAASAIAAGLTLAVFGSVPATLTWVALQTNTLSQEQGVSPPVAKLAISGAIAIGIVLGLLARRL